MIQTPLSSMATTSEAARGSAIDIDVGAGECHHVWGGKEDRDRRDLFGCGHLTTHSFCFVLFLNLFKRDATQLCFLLHQAYYTGSASRARTDGIDQDIVGFESQSQAFIEVTQSCVGGSAGQEGGRWFFSGTTDDIDDASTTCLDHMRNDLA